MTYTLLRSGFSALLILFAFESSGCYHARVTTKQPEVKTQSANVSAFLWGAYQPEDIQAECGKDGKISSFRTTITYPQALATVLTLGIWCPMTIEWECSEASFPDR